MVNDTLSDVLTRIRNGCLNNSQQVSIPLTRLSQQVCHTLEKEGFIESFQRDPSLSDILIVKLKYKDSSLGLTGVQSEALQSKKAFSANSSAVLENRAKALHDLSENKKEALTNANQSPNGITNSQALSKRRPCITNLKRISKPGLRVYARHKQIPTVLGGLGILILSTPKGIMTDREARFRKVGGEILCSIW